MPKMTSLMTTRMTRSKIRKDCLTMRNLKKHPQNANTVTVYLPVEIINQLDRICEESGLSRGKVLTAMVRQTLPKAHMATKTYVVHELTFE